VVQLLTQMAAQMNELATSITSSQKEMATLFDQGSEHLAKMRELVSAPGEVAPRADQFAAEVVELNAVIAALQETGVAPSVKRAAADLSLGFIAPVADGITAGLADRQDEVMGNVRTSVASQSQALTQAADEILAEPKVEPRRFVPLSSAEAVLRYWSDFIPSWAGAISIDLLPVVLVLVLMIANDAMRREAGSLEAAESMSAAELLRAMSLYRELSAVGSAAEPPGDAEIEAAVAAAVTPPPPATDATVTPLDIGRKRGDGPART
jgi:hypothetical protein